MFRSVMVPLDGTPFGEHAAPLAVSVARRCGATLELAHVHIPAVLGGNTSPAQDLTYLEDVASRLGRHAPELVIHSRLLVDEGSGCVADLLACHASEVQADLIVLNSHARGGMTRWWMGSVVDDLIHRTTVPFLVAPAIEHDPGLHPEPVIRHILVALDGSPLAEEILPTAVQLGNAMGAEFTLLRVVEPALVAIPDPVCAVLPPSAALEEHEEREAEDYLARVAARLRGDRVLSRMKTRVVIDPEPAEAICGFLRRQEWHDANVHPADLVAMATHGREGLTRLLLGSVSDRVLQHTPVPLLLQSSVHST
jgi:nucleotide-binding universal stress UspA family protein